MQDWLREELGNIREAGLFRDRKSIRQLPGGWCEWNGRRLRNFAGNDYLDLAHDLRVIEAAIKATQSGGTGATASQLVCGRGPEHELLEQEIASWMQTEGAILFPTGYAANLGAISGLAGKGDVVFSDELNHASLIDGCRLSGAKVVVYPHKNLASLEASLLANPGRRRLIVTDSLFSMDGDRADLPALLSLATRFAAMLVIDEAHALGCFGSSGGGLGQELGLDLSDHVRVGTLSKAVGSLGGFVAGSQELIDFLWNRARSQIFSTTLPPSVCAAAIQAIRLIRSDSERRERLWKNARQLHAGIEKLGFLNRTAEGSPIVPLVLNSPQLAMRVGQELADRGFLVGTIRPPSVPAGTSRLRITLSSGHSSEEIQDFLGAIKAVLPSSNILQR